jgi:hypothetical protein
MWAVAVWLWPRAAASPAPAAGRPHSRTASRQARRAGAPSASGWMSAAAADLAGALETLGLSEGADENDVSRARKKLTHKNRSDEEMKAKIASAAELILAALATEASGGEGAAGGIMAAQPPAPATEEGMPPDDAYDGLSAVSSPTASETSGGTLTGQWRDLVDQAEALEALGLAPEAEADDIQRCVVAPPPPDLAPLESLGSRLPH